MSLLVFQLFPCHVRLVPCVLAIKAPAAALPGRLLCAFHSPTAGKTDSLNPKCGCKIFGFLQMRKMEAQRASVTRPRTHSKERKGLGPEPALGAPSVSLEPHGLVGLQTPFPHAVTVITAALQQAFHSQLLRGSHIPPRSRLHPLPPLPVAFRSPGLGSFPGFHNYELFLRDKVQEPLDWLRRQEHCTWGYRPACQPGGHPSPGPGEKPRGRRKGAQRPPRQPSPFWVPRLAENSPTEEPPA